MTSSSKGAASAAPSLDDARLLKLEKEIDEAADHGIRARWEFGRMLLAERVGKQLPAGRLDELVQLTGKSRQELGARMTFAERYGTDAKVSNAIRDFGSWYAIVNKGLTRSSSDSKPKRSKPLWENESVLTWIGERKRAGQTRDQIVASANAGEHGWPLDGKRLPQNTVDIALAIINRETQGKSSPKKSKGPTQGGKRKRKIYGEIREDGDTRLRRLRIDIADATMKLEHMVLPEDIGLTEESQDDIAELYENLVGLQDWVDRQVAATVACMGDLTIQRTISKLRRLADDPGAEPGERRNARVAADRLQKKHWAALEPVR